MSSDTLQSPSSVSPDDKTLIIVKGGVDIWSLPLAPDPSGSSSTPRPVLASGSGEDHAQFSPDGKWMAYTSDESKTREAYVMAYPGPGGKRQVSSGGASHVRWRSDGRELFYLTRSGELMAAEITVRADALDGTKFIVAEGVERRNAAPQALTLVENWTGLLTMVPCGKSAQRRYSPGGCFTSSCRA